MATESANHSRRAARRVEVADRRPNAGLARRTHRRRRTRDRAGWVVGLGVGRGCDAGAALGSRPESLSAGLNRRAGGGGGAGRVRSAPRRDVTHVHISSPTSAPAAAAVESAGLGSFAAVRHSARARGSAGACGRARLRVIHAAEHGPLHGPPSERCVAGEARRISIVSVLRRRVSAAPGEADGRCGLRGRAGANASRAVSARVRAYRAGIDGSDCAGLRACANQSRLSATAVLLSRRSSA